jgi:hypothetical protein
MRTFKLFSMQPVIALTLLCWLTLLLVVACEKRDTTTSRTSKIVVQNYYWAKPGMEKAVYEQRLLASSVREKYGHPVGRVLRLISAADSLPDVIWECEYPGMKARKKDVDRLMNNEEFNRVANKMATLIEKFDRAVYEVNEFKPTVE